MDMKLPSNPNNVPEQLRKTSLGFISNPKGKRAQYYMNIMNEAYINMRLNGESDQSFKKRFTSKRSRQYDYLHDKQNVFSSANECSVRSSVFTNTGNQVKPGDGCMLYHTISEYTKFINKIDHPANQLKKHDCTLFYANGIFLKQGSDFQHNFNKPEIESIQNKHLSLTRELNIIKGRMQDYQRIFKDKRKVYIGRKKKERK